MLAAVVRASLRAPFIVVLAAFCGADIAAATLLRAKCDVFPEFVPAQAAVQVEAPGLAPRGRGTPRHAAAGERHQWRREYRVHRSESIQGLSSLNVTFTEGTDVFRDRQLLAERISEAALSLPAGVKTPVLTPMTSSTMDLLKLGFTSQSMSPSWICVLSSTGPCARGCWACPACPARSPTAADDARSRCRSIH